jgi:hypothetical protein
MKLIKKLKQNGFFSLGGERERDALWTTLLKR